MLMIVEETRVVLFKLKVLLYLRFLCRLIPRSNMAGNGGPYHLFACTLHGEIDAGGPLYTRPPLHFLITAGQDLTDLQLLAPCWQFLGWLFPWGHHITRRKHSSETRKLRQLLCQFKVLRKSNNFCNSLVTRNRDIFFLQNK